MYEQSQLRALIETAVDGVLSIDTGGRISLFNPAAERIFQRSAEDMLGQPVELLMPTHHASNHSGYIERYVQTGEARIIGIGRRVQGQLPGGSLFPMHLSVGEFMDAGERYFVGIIRDLTEETAAQRRAQDLQAQLELIGRHAAVSEMGAALAHELNQPLTAIDLFLVAAERQLDKDPARAKELFARVRTEAERAGGIVRRIRQMVERTDGEKETFSIAAVVNEAVELCRVVQSQPSAITVGALPDDHIFGDRTQLRMILVNLIKNSLDATEGHAEPQVHVRGAGGAMASVEVLDNGPGVDEAFEKRLFEPFASTKSRGLGIGLSICRTIAETHGGRLTYVAPGAQADGVGGALFRLELPREEG
ncbi:MAG: PAS domain S-box protein [Pseudomonadota bacterium]